MVASTTVVAAHRTTAWYSEAFSQEAVWHRGTLLRAA
jgi:hypothetical protein